MFQRWKAKNGGEIKEAGAMSQRQRKVIDRKYQNQDKRKKIRGEEKREGIQRQACERKERKKKRIYFAMLLNDLQ